MAGDTILIDGCEVARAASEKYLAAERRVSQKTGKDIKLYLTDPANVTVGGSYNKILSKPDSRVNLIVPDDANMPAEFTEDELYALALAEYFFADGFDDSETDESSDAPNSYSSQDEYIPLDRIFGSDKKAEELTGSAGLLLNALKAVMLSFGNQGSIELIFNSSVPLIESRIESLAANFPDTAKKPEAAAQEENDGVIPAGAPGADAENTELVDGPKVMRAGSEKYLALEQRLSQKTGKKVNLYLTDPNNIDDCGSYNKFLSRSDSGVNVIVPDDAELTAEFLEDELYVLALAEYLFAVSLNDLMPEESIPDSPLFSPYDPYVPPEMVARADKEAVELTAAKAGLLNAFGLIMYGDNFLSRKISLFSRRIELLEADSHSAATPESFTNPNALPREENGGDISSDTNDEDYEDTPPEYDSQEPDEMSEERNIPQTRPEAFDTSGITNNVVSSGSDSGLKILIFLLLGLIILAAAFYFGFR
ncbi:MAG: hypothetical protein FWC57_03230 [Endomicrobia bacterium]|nr:hypothetical protein [Endomicrobiia bacterium]